MSTALYTAHGIVTGGRADGHGRTADGALEVDLRQPKELGGDGDGVNPEQLFAIGYAACFATSVALVGRRKRLPADDVAIASHVSLLPTDGGAFRLAVALDVTLPSMDDPRQAAELVAIAHQVCPYSNATRGNIAVDLTVNGTRL
ncbi:organic hydroperoxide resistance protein [Catellatospora tritici]|uniref:organic hydroperoxide resistance protein n=1 Tax=Catellatospora tritici TaxID=2851566 RepID=UPI001C2DB39A|nr:organic hydroperoxide resistance protein [Catellatospora tritici]MBV1851244.1 organic hydroperoxide resistance protein [Catellatospora tritici]